MSVDITNPEKLSKEGKAEYKRGNFLAAARAFSAAQTGFESANQEVMAAEMANNACVAYLQAGEAEAALRAVEGTEVIFQRNGDLRRQGMAAGNRAMSLEALDRLEEALEEYELSVALLKGAGEADMLASVTQSLSTLQLRMGRQLEALATMQAGLEEIKKPSPSQRMLKRLINVPFELLNRKR